MFPPKAWGAVIKTGWEEDVGFSSAEHEQRQIDNLAVIASYSHTGLPYTEDFRTPAVRNAQRHSKA